MDEAEILPLAVEKFKEGVVKYGLSVYGTASVGVLYEDGTYCMSKNQACHLGLQEFDYGVGLVAAMSGINLGHCPVDDRVCRVFLDYLINRSPYSKYFLSYDVDEVMEDRCVVISADAPSNVLASALILTRCLWEFQCTSLSFFDFVNCGVPEDIAFVVALGANYDLTVFKGVLERGGAVVLCEGFRNKMLRIDFNVATYEQGHYGFQPRWFTIKSLKNFINRDFVNPNLPYKEDVDYRGIRRLFIDKGGDGSENLFSFIAGIYEHGDCDVGDDSNIFALSTTNPRDRHTAWDTTVVSARKFKINVLPKLLEKLGEV